ncbi:chemotaxis protein CheW [Desulfonatronospira sp. MSAO_Bac3]|uniref:chemotaxis protein CheW n=1 Tax=Desulfonatronospira sp. MSAO_Bac3 TaxID=2293857 RepID=UPI000FF7BF68|nr:chemotaxis protein CheW [Desulfonatronospira sp. MSAO_Bac3]RQD74018.1 MAG: chemotaxis protein CheW [Desulfonatronospira sp. MSAO_Bac3]
MTEKGTGQSNTYLTFYLDQELFGLNIDSVREVLEYTAITKVPRTADYMRGVINVRGRPVPVVDLRKKFGLSQAEQTVDTCIIIVEVEINGESSIMGALVDGVQEVLNISSEQIEETPRLGTAVNMKFILGLGKLENKFVILLDIQAVFSLEELTSMAESSVEQSMGSSMDSKQEDAGLQV